MKESLSRRRFLQQVLLWSAGLTLDVPAFRPAVVRAAESPLVAAVTGADYLQLVAKTIEMLGGIERFVSRGDRVVVKPNIGWDRSPEQGANTHPLVVKALVELALDAGAKTVQLFDHTCNEKRRCYTNSGITAMVESIGDKRVSLEHIDDRKFVPVDIAAGKSLRRWDIYKDALTADCYLNVPVAKHHGLSRLSLGLKNHMGVIGGNRGRLHQDLGQQLADLATVIQPRLTVIDATRTLVKNGPQGGRIEDVVQRDTLIASADPVAADAYTSTLFGLAADHLSSTRAAYAMGLGEMALEKMDIREAAI